MSNIERRRSQLPSKLNSVLAKAIFPNTDNGNNSLELIISISEGSINIKEFSSYLDLIYRVDGFFSEVGYTRYVHRRNQQIEITRIRFGSIEVVIERLLSSSNVDTLIIIYLVLKYLPQVINSFTDSAGKIADFLVKREEYLEKRNRRKFRKQIRELISEEVELIDLDKKTKEKLVDYLDEAYVRNYKRVIPASRFARNFVKNIQLLLKGKNE